MGEVKIRQNNVTLYGQKIIDESHYEVLRSLIIGDEDYEADDKSKSLIDELTISALLKSEEKNY